MINLNITFEEMKKKISFIEYLVDVSVSPKEDPEKFVGFDGLDYLSKNNISMENARCISSKFISDSLGIFGYGNSFKDYFRELQYNACMHGNKWNKDLYLKIKIGIGERGLVGQIENEGKGFEYEKIVNNLQNKNKYSKNRGCGFRVFNERNSYIVSFEKGGLISNLMFKISEKDMILWRNFLVQGIVQND